MEEKNKEENKPLTLAELKEFTKEVLLPATKKQLEDYTKEVLLPATQKQFIDYTTEVLLPAFELTLNNKFKESNSFVDIKLNVLAEKLVTKKEFNEFKNKIYTDIDSLIEKS
jgi:hypothetical protein